MIDKKEITRKQQINLLNLNSHQGTIWEKTVFRFTVPFDDLTVVIEGDENTDSGVVRLLQSETGEEVWVNNKLKFLQANTFCWLIDILGQQEDWDMLLPSPDEKHVVNILTKLIALAETIKNTPD